MAWLAGLFLIAHAVVDLAIWATTATTAQPFDPCRSWLTTPLGVEDRAHAVATAATFARRAVIPTIGGLGAIGRRRRVTREAVVGAPCSAALDPIR